MSPLRMILIAMAGSVAAIGFGVKIIRKGLRGVREAKFPYNATQDMTGKPAQAVGVVTVILGAAGILGGIAIIAFGFWRIPQLV